MTCNNFTHYIDNINLNCGNSVPVMMGSCEIICMTNIVILLNECLEFLKVMNLNEELENIVEFCFNKNNGGH
jgi:hypothetical protein